MKSIQLIQILALTSTVTAFQVTPPASSISHSSTTTSCQASRNNNHEVVDRRNFGKVLSAGIVGTVSVALTGAPQTAFADVSDGNSLPEGAAQFSRLIRLKGDLISVTKRVTEHADEIDKKEWDNLSDFLRFVYKGGEDMKGIAKSTIYDPEKKKKADEDIKLLQKLAQAGDGTVSKEDAAAYGVLTKKATSILDDFFDLLRDVPDEI